MINIQIHGVVGVTWDKAEQDEPKTLRIKTVEGEQAITLFLARPATPGEVVLQAA